MHWAVDSQTRVAMNAGDSNRSSGAMVVVVVAALDGQSRCYCGQC